MSFSPRCHRGFKVVSVEKGRGMPAEAPVAKAAAVRETLNAKVALSAKAARTAVARVMGVTAPARVDPLAILAVVAHLHRSDLLRTP